ncbi:MAG: response regulator [Pseudomonadota bacterium]|jgi:CheY-like chemotaxis protein
MDVATASIADERAKVLIVENDPAVRRSMQLLLRGRGFDVRAYAAGPAMLAAAALQPPDCLVADYLLEDTDGIALLKELRELGWDGPAILVSAFASQKVSARALDAGFAEVFEKPLRERALVEAVSRLVGRRGDD